MASDKLRDLMHKGVAKAEVRQARRDKLTGFWVDDPLDPGVAAFVCQGRVVDLVIPDSYMTLPRQTLESIINAVIVNAYMAWSPAVQTRSTTP